MRLKFKWIFTLLIAFTIQLSYGQEKTIKGVITDASGPLPGVNVVVKGTQRGVSSGFDGSFAIQAKKGEELVFSFMGMTEVTKLITAETSVLNVKMQEDAKVLEAVVVTALGIKKATKAVTYAVQGVQGEELTEARSSNLVNALSGRVAGAQITNSTGSVGGSSRVVLRGPSSITGNNQAMFVVDGVIFNNSSQGNGSYSGGRDLPNGVASINPDDIESISVLKGPTAAALYGIRASNGVILITTKSGKKNGKFEVSLNTNLTFSNPLLLPQYQNSYGQSNEDEALGGYFEFVDGAGSGAQDGSDRNWGVPLDRGFNFVQWDSFKYGGAATPWISHPNSMKNFFETGYNLTNSLSIMNGNDKGNYRFSIGNSDERGIIPFTDFKKVNVGFNGTMKISDKFTAGANATYYNDKSNNLPSMSYAGDNVMQQFLFVGRNVNFTDLKDWRSFPLAKAGPGANRTPLNSNTLYQNNPYWALETNRNTYDRDRLTGSMFINYKFSNKFSVNTKLMLDNYTQRETTRSAIGTYDAPLGAYSEVYRRFTEINLETLLNYNTNLTQDLKLNLNFGSNTMKRVNTGISADLTGGLQLPDLYTLSNAASGSTPIIGSNYTEQRINSLLGFGQISYKDYAFLDFTGRSESLSILPKSNRSFFYPSVTGSLIVSDIFGFNTSKVNYVKVRGGWSKVGTSGSLEPYSLNKNYDLNSNGFGTQASIPNLNWNPNIKPESVQGIEIGLDANAFNNRIRFSGTYYDQNSTDLITQIGKDASVGFLSGWDNVAEMTNKGIELQLGLTAIKKENFSFDVDLNFAKNVNKVETLGLNNDALVLGGQWNMQLQAIPGQPYGSIVGYPLVKTPDGQVIYENGLPKANNRELVTLGNITPDWTGGANFSFRYKNFTISSLFDVKMGGDIFTMTYLFGRQNGSLIETLAGRETGVVGDGVVADGNGGYVPNNVVVSTKIFNEYTYNQSNFTETGVFDASFVKWRNMVVGYNIPKKLLKNTFIQEARFSIVGNNLAILHKNVPHIDPETAFGNGNAGQGMELAQSPTTRSIGFNINVKF